MTEPFSWNACMLPGIVSASNSWPTEKPLRPASTLAYRYHTQSPSHIAEQIHYALLSAHTHTHSSYRHMWTEHPHIIAQILLHPSRKYFKIFNLLPLLSLFYCTAVVQARKPGFKNLQIWPKSIKINCLLPDKTGGIYDFCEEKNMTFAFLSCFFEWFQNA